MLTFGIVFSSFAFKDIASCKIFGKHILNIKNEIKIIICIYSSHIFYNTNAVPMPPVFRHSRNLSNSSNTSLRWVSIQFFRSGCSSPVFLIKSYQRTDIIKSNGSTENSKLHTSTQFLAGSRFWKMFAFTFTEIVTAIIAHKIIPHAFMLG